MIPQVDGSGAIIPSSLTPKIMFTGSPLSCAVATAVVATNAVTDIIANFMIRLVGLLASIPMTCSE